MAGPCSDFPCIANVTGPVLPSMGTSKKETWPFLWCVLSSCEESPMLRETVVGSLVIANTETRSLAPRLAE